ncbi:DUF4158 domain-containing protein [Nonomuraea sp. NPDC050680]|uniref:DUF4158 domain-containing protein n=1 Tax=Nonomuraea sp. NPDC050680 TaxID=3154630 RepID=UPI0033D126DB
MPVDFLSDSEAAKYGRYDGPPSRAEMEKIFFLDNEDTALIKGHRGRPHQVRLRSAARERSLSGVLSG